VKRHHLSGLRAAPLGSARVVDFHARLVGGSGAIPSIFISYRRDDTAGHAGRLADALISHFGRANVFIDVAAISPGVDFEQRTRQALASCQLALILIGPRWLTLENPDGTRRIDADGDLVRQEVADALNRPDLTVVPVLVESASMPTTAELPPDIASLAKLNAFDLTNKRWHYDVAQLAQFARRYDKWWWRMLLRTPRLALRVAPPVGLAVVAVVVVAVASSGTDKAARIASCEHTHGLASAQGTRRPRPGETQIDRSQITGTYPTQPEFMQKTYASCSWPPPPGADADGYRAITLTMTNGPKDYDASGQDFADIIESRCKRLRLVYVTAFMGQERLLPPFEASPGDIWSASGTVSGLSRIAEIGSSAQQRLGLPFYPPPGTVVVLHSQHQLQWISCLS
jgi:TIR domain